MNQDIEDLLHYVGRYLLDYPSQLEVQTETENGTTTFLLDVHHEDRGQIIGKGGRTAKALRSVIRASGALHDERFQLEIVD